MTCTVSIDMIDSKKFDCFLATALTFAAIGIDDSLFELPSLIFSLCRDFYSMISGIFAARLQISLVIFGLPLTSLFKMVSMISTLIFKISLASLSFLKGFAVRKNSLAVLFVPSFLGFCLCHNNFSADNYSTFSNGQILIQHLKG